MICTEVAGMKRILVKIVLPVSLLAVWMITCYGLIGGVVVILRMVMVLMEIIKIISDTSGHDVQRCR